MKLFSKALKIKRLQTKKNLNFFLKIYKILKIKHLAIYIIYKRNTHTRTHAHRYEK